jgi:hypothetical protein
MRAGIMGLIRNLSLEHHHVMMIQQNHFRKFDSRKSMLAIVFAGQKLIFLDFCQKNITRILVIYAVLFWKGSKPAPLLRPEN